MTIREQSIIGEIQQLRAGLSRLEALVRHKIEQCKASEHLDQTKGTKTTCLACGRVMVFDQGGAGGT